ncbi:hypothetical protein Q3G72_028850 [Acer saccharum]|nr:hypothetical protein Q3G72_028850 [Acer saccharum]
MEGQQQAMQEGRGAGDAPQLNFMIAKSFNCVIPTLLGVIQVNHEGKDKFAFETHPAQMWIHAVVIRNACRQLHHKINTIISSFSRTTSIQQQRLPV